MKVKITEELSVLNKLIEEVSKNVESHESDTVLKVGLTDTPDYGNHLYFEYGKRAGLRVSYIFASQGQRIFRFRISSHGAYSEEDYTIEVSELEQNIRAIAIRVADHIRGMHNTAASLPAW